MNKLNFSSMKRSRQVKGDIPSYDAMRKFHTEEGHGGGGETGEGGGGGGVSIYEQLKQTWAVQETRAKQAEGGYLNADGSIRAGQIEKYMDKGDIEDVMDLFNRWQEENFTGQNKLYNAEYKDFTTTQKNTGLYWFIQRKIFEKNLAERNARDKEALEAQGVAEEERIRLELEAEIAAETAALAYAFDESWLVKPIDVDALRNFSVADLETWNREYVQTANADQLEVQFIKMSGITTDAQELYNTTSNIFRKDKENEIRMRGREDDAVNGFQINISTGLLKNSSNWIQSKMVGGADAHDIFMFNIHDKFDRTIQSLQAIQDERTSTDAYGNKKAKNFNEMGDWINGKAQIENLDKINRNMKLITYLGMRNKSM